MPPLPSCDICGSSDVMEIKCKVVCRNCGTILMSCSDLALPDAGRAAAAPSRAA